MTNDSLELDVPGPIAEMGRRHADVAHLCSDLTRAFGVIAAAFRAGNKLLVAGNGGSHADALHLSGELLKSFRALRPVPAEFARKLAAYPFGAELAPLLEVGLPAVVLGQNPSLDTAYLNDRFDARALAAQECIALAKPGDVLVVLSTSGRAENLLWAMAVMKAVGGATIAFTGRDGGAVGQAADVEVRAPGATTPDVQEYHIKLYHALCAALEDDFFA